MKYTQEEEEEDPAVATRTANPLRVFQGADDGRQLCKEMYLCNIATMADWQIQNRNSIRNNEIDQGQQLMFA